jgi:nicotinamide mononucleotide transporter
VSHLWTALFSFLLANWTELLGSITGAVCVWLLVKENIWNWPVGIANNIFYIYIFFKAGLFADMGLQFVYIAIACYGWWNWLHGGQNRSQLEVRCGSRRELLAYVAIAFVATAILYGLLRQFTPSTVPFADGLTTALFLTAQFVMSRKVVENWWFWITGDVLVMGLYIYKHLYLTTGLYALFLALCIAGLLHWQESARKSRPELAAASRA